MNTISCNIIQDLIPLYIENMVSEDSKTLSILRIAKTAGSQLKRCKGR